MSSGPVEAESFFGYSFANASLANDLLIGLTCIALISIVVKLISIAAYKRIPLDHKSLNTLLRRRIKNGIIICLSLIIILMILIPAQVFSLAFITGLLSLCIVCIICLFDPIRNLIAGQVILYEKKVGVGDRIYLQNIIGTVKSMGLYSISLEAENSRICRLPNRLLLTQVSEIQKADALSLESYDVEVAGENNLDHVQRTLKRAALSVRGVENEPSVSAHLKAIELKYNYRTMIIQVSWWADKRASNLAALRSRVIYSLKLALEGLAIDAKPLSSDLPTKPNRITPIR